VPANRSRERNVTKAVFLSCIFSREQEKLTSKSTKMLKKTEIKKYLINAKLKTEKVTDSKNEPL
jgi:hypothetical protein